VEASASARIFFLYVALKMRRFAFGVTSGSGETDIIETAFCPSLIDYFLPALLSN